MSEDVFLADWLAGKIPDEALKEKVSPGDFEAYLALRQATANMSTPDADAEAAFARIRAAHHAPATKAIRLWPYVGIAASLLLLIGLAGAFWVTDTFETGKIPKTITLSDGSRIWLNAGSRVEYPALFFLRRHVGLQGEAYFEVRKGSRFVVETSGGTVAVLGTRFNVAQSEGFFQAECFQGRVRVSSCGKSVILEKGQGARCLEGIFEPVYAGTGSPSWRGRETTFKSAPLAWVVKSVEKRYAITIAYPENLSGLRFTGSVTHDDLDKALLSICLPLHLRYATRGGKIEIRP